MAWQVSTSLLTFRPNLRNVILVYIKKNCVNHKPTCKKRNHVVKIYNLLINHSGVTSTNTVHQMFAFQCYLIILPCTSLSGLHSPDTHRPSMGSCLLVFPVGQLCSDQISLSPLPIQKSTIESTSIASPPMPKIIYV